MLKLCLEVTKPGLSYRKPNLSQVQQRSTCFAFRMPNKDELVIQSISKQGDATVLILCPYSPLNNNLCNSIQVMPMKTIHFIAHLL